MDTLPWKTGAVGMFRGYPGPSEKTKENDTPQHLHVDQQRCCNQGCPSGTTDGERTRKLLVNN